MTTGEILKACEEVLGRDSIVILLSKRFSVDIIVTVAARKAFTEKIENEDLRRACIYFDEHLDLVIVKNFIKEKAANEN